MKREDAAKLLPIIEAWSKGGKIQFRGTDGRWIDLLDDDDISWHSYFEFRIKPKPVSIWVASWVDSFGVMNFSTSISKAQVESFSYKPGFQLHEIVRDAE